MASFLDHSSNPYLQKDLASKGHADGKFELEESKLSKPKAEVLTPEDVIQNKSGCTIILLFTFSALVGRGMLCNKMQEV